MSTGRSAWRRRNLGKLCDAQLAVSFGRPTPEQVRLVARYDARQAEVRAARKALRKAKRDARRGPVGPHVPPSRYDLIILGAIVLAVIAVMFVNAVASAR